jgi:hypothetical protein
MGRPAGTIRMTCILGVAMCALGALPAFAQNDYVLWLTPKISDFDLIAEAGGRYYGSADVEDRRDEFGLMKHDFRLRVPLRRTESSEWLLGSDLSRYDVDGAPRLRRSLDDVPGELYDVNVGLTYRRITPEEWIVGGNLKIGSDSDEPFNSEDEMYLKGMGFLSIPHLEYTAWLVLLHVNSHSDFPVMPAIGYRFPLSKSMFAAAGFPFVAVGGDLTEKVGLQLSFFPMHEVSAKMSYRPAERLTTFAAFDWESDFFSRAARRDSDDRLEFEEKRLEIGAAYSLNEAWLLKVNGGYAFDRSYAEGDDRDELRDRELGIDDTWFGGLSVSARF